jgi:hypothetical protein
MVLNCTVVFQLGAKVHASSPVMWRDVGVCWGF